MRRRTLSLRSQEFPASSDRWNFCRSTRFIPDSPRHLLFPISRTSRFARSRRPKVVRRHAGDRLDRKTEEVLRHLKGATTPEETGTAGKVFHLRSRIAAIALTWLRA
jgi:hypothetical protein